MSTPRKDLGMHAKVWQLAWPMILSNITVPLLGLVDTAVIGHLPDPRYLGAVAIGASLFSVLYWAFGFLRMGTTGLTAQALGAGQRTQTQLLLGQSLCLGLAIGSLLILLQQPVISIGLALMDAGPQISSDAARYCDIRIYSAPAVLANYALLGWFLGMQNSRLPLVLLVTTNLINILLDLLFVLGFGMDVEGVALATLIADYASLLLGLWLAHRYLGFRLTEPLAKQLLQVRDYLTLLNLNRYLFVRTLCLLLTFAFFTAQGARQGALILSANAVLLNFLMLISYGLDGFAHAIEALCGRMIGAGNLQQFYRACRSATGWSLLTAGLFMLGFALGGKALIRLLTDIPEVVKAAEIYLPWLIVLPLIGVWGYLLDGIFIGATRFRAMQNCMLLSSLGCFLPAWYLLQPLGNHGLWLAMCLFLLARALSGGWLFMRYSKQQRWHVKDRDHAATKMVQQERS